MSDRPGAGDLQRRLRKVARPIANRLWDLTLEGYERLPLDGPAILCPNHISFLDSALLMLTVPRNISFVGKAEYMDSWKTKYLFPAVGMIPIDRTGGEKSQGALDAAKAVLERGELFAIFPEGTRSRNGRLHKGRSGAARLAMDVGCPIYPVGIIGTIDIQPPGAKAPRPFKPATIRIGRPVKPQRYAHRSEKHLAWRSMIDEVMFEIRELSGQEYVNTYAGSESSEPVGVSRPGRVSDAVAATESETAERQLVSLAG
ncbi:MAG: 1-acyl-sn-glycerol-3-phosphate acyltransferase [Actinomycetota bacterium]|nr:1-acyl-sn-glycerol-3-phosphate acyltransferase [Actinomycetota bacterium]